MNIQTLSTRTPALRAQQPAPPAPPESEPQDQVTLGGRLLRGVGTVAKDTLESAAYFLGGRGTIEGGMLFGAVYEGTSLAIDLGRKAHAGDSDTGVAASAAIGA